MFFIILGSLADFAALSFAAQSLVATLGSLTLVSNVLLAPILLKEHISPADYRATFLIVSGCTIAVAFGQHKSEIYTLSRYVSLCSVFILTTCIFSLMSLYRTVNFALYIISVLLLVAIMLLMIWHIESTMKSSREGQPYTLVAGFCSALMTCCSYRKGSFWAHAHMFLYPAVSGIMGAQSVLLAKSRWLYFPFLEDVYPSISAELVKTMISGRGFMFAHIGTYLILGGMFTRLLYFSVCLYSYSYGRSLVFSVKSTG
jgi:hypothetical protein